MGDKKLLKYIKANLKLHLCSKSTYLPFGTETYTWLSSMMFIPKGSQVVVVTVACCADHASYAVLTHSIHFSFLSRVCSILFVADISKRCLS